MLPLASEKEHSLNVCHPCCSTVCQGSSFQLLAVPLTITSTLVGLQSSCALASCFECEVFYFLPTRVPALLLTVIFPVLLFYVVIFFQFWSALILAGSFLCCYTSLYSPLTSFIGVCFCFFSFSAAHSLWEFIFLFCLYWKLGRVCKFRVQI